MKGEFNMILFGKEGCEYRPAEITWECMKNMKKKMKKMEERLVSLVSEMV